VLAFLAAPARIGGMDAAVQAQYDGCAALIRENPRGAHQASKNIAARWQNMRQQWSMPAPAACFSPSSSWRAKTSSREEYAEFGKPYDLQVLQAVQGAPFNLLHICGPQAYFELGNEYPVHAVNWAAPSARTTRASAEAARLTTKALIGGVDELGALQSGTPEAVIEEALAAIRATGGRRLLLAPGCGTSMDVPTSQPARCARLRKAADLAAVQRLKIIKWWWIPGSMEQYAPTANLIGKYGTLLQTFSIKPSTDWPSVISMP
jgi:uroporphyrinogen decarboxylase